MIKKTLYQVYFESPWKPGSPWRQTHGAMAVKARSEDEAIARVRAAVPGSIAHWINRNANEAVA
jgi:hypothetical protein